MVIHPQCLHPVTNQVSHYTKSLVIPTSWSVVDTTPHYSNRKQNIHHITSSPTQTYNILQHAKAKTLSLTMPTTQQTFPQTPTQSTQQTYKSMHHIHTSTVSRHLATRGNNKILRTPPSHISSSEEILSRLTRRTLAQIRTN